MSSPDLGNNIDGKEEIAEIQKHIKTLNDNLNQRFIKKSLTQFGFLEKSYENEGWERYSHIAHC
jgi:hypothetical protein